MPWIDDEGLCPSCSKDITIVEQVYFDQDTMPCPMCGARLVVRIEGTDLMFDLAQEEKTC